jgi:catalase
MKNGEADRGRHVNGGVGVGWVDEPEGPEVRASLAERVGAQQKKVAAGNPELGGRIGRGQHQKQLLGAFGTLRIDDSIPAAAKHGPFAAPGRFKVACRISNGQPCPFHDQAPDVRGVALKFFTGGGVETDLVMTNEGGRSHARNAVEFTLVADILAAFQIKGKKLDAMRALAKGIATSASGLFGAARVAAILGKETILHKVESMTTERYWGSVVMLGDAAVKYSLHPHPSTRPGTDGDPKGVDYLREDLRNRLAQGPILYDLCLQFFVDEKATPINDASVAWRAPLVPLGEVEVAAKPSDDEEALIDRMAFNPGHGFEPLGITHVRKVAYATSAQNRGALTTEDVRPHFVSSIGAVASSSSRGSL